MAKITKPERLWDDATKYSAALGCSVCPIVDRCGGLHCEHPPFDCLDFCCGGKANCTTVCRNNIGFINQYAEANAFYLDRLPLVRSVAPDFSHKIVPMIYHGSKRKSPFSEEVACLRLYDLIDFKRGTSRFSNERELRTTFKLGQQTQIVLSGVDHDPKIEAIWRLGSRRASVFAELAKLPIIGVSTPNFSCVLDRPRTDDLHSIARIAQIFNEMAIAGLPVWLHPNARTAHDMERWWREFISPRDDIHTIAYEFITGSGLINRMPEHCKWLNSLAKRRDLSIVIRGNPLAIDLLSDFKNITYIESTSFVKATKRQWPQRIDNAKLIWQKNESEYIDQHLSTAHQEVKHLLMQKFDRLRIAD